MRGPHPWVGGVDIRKEILKLNGSEGVFMGENLTLDVVHDVMGQSKSQNHLERSEGC